MKPDHRICIVPVMLALAIVAGCSKSEKSDAKKATTQVAAKVNSTEITISQINNVLARIPNVMPEATERAKREILDRLIDAELAREEAIGKKLDRSPNVLQALEAAKTEILARAYVEQFAAAQPKPTPEEVKKYYAEHPELFSQRRNYSIEEISLPAKEGLAAKLREQVAKTRSLQDIAAWLKSQGIQFTANSGVRAAEQFLLEYLPQMQTMKDGDIRVFDAVGGLQVIRVAASKAAPVDEARATPRIQQFLFNQRSTAAIARDRKQLKEKAKLEYIGEFAASAAEAEAKAKAAAQGSADQLSKASAAAEATAKVEADAQAKADELAKARRAAEAKARLEAESQQAGSSKPAQPLTPDIEKGVRGLSR